MSAEAIVRRALRTVSLPEHLIDRYTPEMLRTFNKTIAEGHSSEKAEQLLTEALRRTGRVAPEPAALTDAVVKRAFMEVAEQMQTAQCRRQRAR